MERQVQFVEIKVEVPVGFQVEGYDYPQPDGLFLDDENRVKINNTKRQGRRKYLILRRV